MSLLADDLSFDSQKQSKPVCSKMAIPSVVVLLKNKQNKLLKNREKIVCSGNLMEVRNLWFSV